MKKILDDSGLTITDAAQRIGVSRSNLSSYLNGRRNPKRVTVQRIANAFHVDISEISGYETEQTENMQIDAPIEKTGDEFIDSVYRFIHKDAVTNEPVP